MWIIIENEKILKVSVTKDNDGMLFIENCPVDLINNPANYNFVDGEFIVMAEVVN